MKAKYPGVCQCGAKFPKYAEIEYSRTQHKVTSCPTCRKDKPAEPDLAQMVDMAYEDQCAAMCGPGL